jgi:hypothetical protein
MNCPAAELRGIIDTHGQARGTLNGVQASLDRLRRKSLRFAPGRIHPRVNTVELCGVLDIPSLDGRGLRGGCRKQYPSNTLSLTLTPQGGGNNWHPEA